MLSLVKALWKTFVYILGRQNAQMFDHYAGMFHAGSHNWSILKMVQVFQRPVAT